MKHKKIMLTIATWLSTNYLLNKYAENHDLSSKSSSQIVSTTLYSPNLHLDWNYDVYLPAGYNDSSQKYPVLYMLHGIYGNHTNLLERINSKQILDKLMNKQNKKMIVVFVDGFNSFYVNQKDGLQMEDAIIKDLIPTINQKFRTLKDAQHQAIGGISMGGYGAARLALKYPEYFKHAILLSPAVWQNLAASDPIKMKMHAFTDGQINWSNEVYRSLFPTQYLRPQAQKVNFFIESTSADSIVPIKDVKAFVKSLSIHNIKNKFIKDSSDDHNWTYWTKVIPHAYSWALNQLN